MKTMFLKLVAVPVIAAAVLLAGCTSAEVVANIESACSAIGAGLQAVGVVTGSIPGGAVINNTISQVITGVGSDCGPFATNVGNAVEAITSIGGTAHVSVAGQSPSTNPASHKLATRFGIPLEVSFTVTPSGQVIVDPKSMARLAALRAAN